MHCLRFTGALLLSEQRRHVCLLQGSVQRSETVYSPADGAAVRRQDCRRSQVHLQSRTKHVRLGGRDVFLVFCTVEGLFSVTVV